MFSLGNKPAATFAVLAWAALLIAMAVWMSLDNLAVALTVAGAGAALALVVVGLNLAARSRRQGD